MLQRLISTAVWSALASESGASVRFRSLRGAIDEASSASRRASSTSTSSASTSFSSLPVIDVDSLLSDSSSTLQERLATAQQLHRACTDVGFFYAKARGITDSDKSASLLSKARRWFEETPLEQKQEIALSAATGFRGWQPLHANVTRYATEEGAAAGHVGDHHEAIDLYKGVTEADKLPPSPVHAPPGTGFPAKSDPELSKELEEHIARCLRLGEGIMRGLALGLGLGDERFFERPENGGTTAESSYWVCRVIQYPPLLLADDDVRMKGGELPRSERISCGMHVDYGSLTLLSATGGDAASDGALQVKNAKGEWVAAPPLRDAVVCNVGDMLKIASGGLYSSTLHRVIHAAPKGGPLPPPRTSIAVFYEPRFDALIKPAGAGGDSGGKDKSEKGVPEPKMYGTHLEEKVLTNFEL